jgi:drug/metabolite transporter (DMT)-like permease
MNASLTWQQVALLSSYAFGMTAGQLLFKLAAGGFTAGTSLAERAVAMLFNGYFIAAVALYVALTFVWVWILSFTPLSRAYPFVALAFALTPLLGGLVFSEPLTARIWIGIGVILCGLVLVAG